MPDPFNLARFLTAQADDFETALAELQRGRKEGHWIWFIFPQLKALGFSSTSSHFGIASLAEAKAYLAHPVLGPRLMQCTAIVNQTAGASLQRILGDVDSLKFRSCVTLFASANPGAQVFQDALQKYFDGMPDQRTLTLLEQLSQY